MSVKFNQLCMRCKKNFVPMRKGDKFPVCVDCQMKTIRQQPEDEEMQKLLDIPEEYYRQSAFLRDIKINCLRYGKLTEKQIEAFKNEVERLKNQ